MFNKQKKRIWVGSLLGFLCCLIVAISLELSTPFQKNRSQRPVQIDQTRSGSIKHLFTRDPGSRSFATWRAERVFFSLIDADHHWHVQEKLFPIQGEAIRIDQEGKKETAKLVAEEGVLTYQDQSVYLTKARMQFHRLDSQFETEADHLKFFLLPPYHFQAERVHAQAN